MALHIIKTAQLSAINDIENLLSDGDQLLLSDDGCYLYTIAASKFVQVQALADHMQTRGLTLKAKEAGVELISIKEWALLTRKHQQIMTW